MANNNEALNISRTNPHLASRNGWLRSQPDAKRDDDEESCPAFGFLRGVHERGLALELRLRDGDREWFPYSLLGSWRYNPSAGLLLKFTGDVVTLVLIRGSNLDAAVNQGGMNLTDRGLQRHRVTWVREMDEEELRTVGEGGPTIDSIEVAEFESQEQLTEWLRANAPSFVRQT